MPVMVCTISGSGIRKPRHTRPIMTDIGRYQYMNQERRFYLFVSPHAKEPALARLGAPGRFRYTPSDIRLLITRLTACD